MSNPAQNLIPNNYADFERLAAIEFEGLRPIIECAGLGAISREFATLPRLQIDTLQTELIDRIPTYSYKPTART